MNSDDKPGWNTLARYVAGESSEAEKSQVLAWAATDPARRRFLKSVRRSWKAAAHPADVWNVDGALARVKSSAREGRGSPGVTGARSGTDGVPAGPHRVSRFRPGSRLAVAAVLASVALSGAAYLGVRSIGGGGLLGRDSQVAVQRLITEKGQRARVDLSDGTEVMLGPGSRIEMLPGFGGESREVRLAGEAYFDVVPDASRPFLVHVRGAVTRVLGTEFGIRAYPDDASVKVVVAEGTVSLRSTQSDSAAAIVHAGELGELPSLDGQVVTRTVDLDVHLGWRNGRLTFENAALSQVAKEIERWYGIPVRIGDASLQSRRLTASFRDQPIEAILEVVALTLELEWRRIGEAYVFFPKSSPTLASRNSSFPQ